MIWLSLVENYASVVVSLGITLLILGNYYRCWFLLSFWYISILYHYSAKTLPSTYWYVKVEWVYYLNRLLPWFIIIYFIFSLFPLSLLCEMLCLIIDITEFLCLSQLLHLQIFFIKFFIIVIVCQIFCMCCTTPHLFSEFCAMCYLLVHCIETSELPLIWNEICTQIVNFRIFGGIKCLFNPYSPVSYFFFTDMTCHLSVHEIMTREY